MAEQNVKLLGVWASPYSRRVELALKLKGIQYEYLEQDLSNKSDLLLNSNPVHKKIPVLIHNGKPIAESLVILEYIDETWTNNPLLPKDPFARSVARFWAKFLDEKINQTAMKTRKAEGKEREQAMEELPQLLKLFENELKGKEFFGGESVGLVDIVGFFTAYWFQIAQEATGVEVLPEDKFPVLCKWVDKLLSIDVIKECVPPRDEHVARFRARFGVPKSAPK